MSWQPSKPPACCATLASFLLTRLSMKQVQPSKPDFLCVDYIACFCSQLWCRLDVLHGMHNMVQYDFCLSAQLTSGVMSVCQTFACCGQGQGIKTAVAAFTGSVAFLLSLIRFADCICLQPGVAKLSCCVSVPPFFAFLCSVTAVHQTSAAVSRQACTCSLSLYCTNTLSFIQAVPIWRQENSRWLLCS